MKIGLLGGTFDPIHIGHLMLAQECWARLTLDKVIFIPAHTNPLKGEKDGISVSDRLNMVRLALEADPRFEISTFEIDSKGPSYTIDTLRYFRERYKEDDLFFLAGADSLETLSGWKDINEIFSLARFCVANRPGYAIEGAYTDKVKVIDIPLVDISSTMIRGRVKSKDPIDFLVPQKAVKYIREKGLYRD